MRRKNGRPCAHLPNTSFRTLGEIRHPVAGTESYDGHCRSRKCLQKSARDRPLTTKRITNFRYGRESCTHRLATSAPVARPTMQAGRFIPGLRRELHALIRPELRASQATIPRSASVHAPALRCRKSRGGRNNVATAGAVGKSLEDDNKPRQGCTQGTQRAETSPHSEAESIRMKRILQVQDFQCGEHTNAKRGYTSRNRGLISATNAGRAAALGGNLRRTTQPFSFFHSVASTGQPACLVHSPFSVEYQ